MLQLCPLPLPKISNLITINGRTYVLAPDMTVAPNDIQPTVNLAEVTNEDTAHAMLKDNLFKFKAYLCVNRMSHISIDWSKTLTSVDLFQVPVEPVAYTTNHELMSCLPIAPFILDSSANCHVLLKHSDFKSLHPIPPINVKGFDGSSAKAIGMGSIKLRVASRIKISLSNVLFIPSSTIRLMSMSALNRSGNYP
jgi:hypothetical protein